MEIIKVKDYEEMSEKAFSLMRAVLDDNKHPVLGLATGSTPLGLYGKMKRFYEEGFSYKHCITFNLDEYLGLPEGHPQSYRHYMYENLFNSTDFQGDNIHIPDSTGDPETICNMYEHSLDSNRIDLQILGLGGNGHIAFNEPGTPFDSLTHVVDLTEQTREDNSRFFERKEDVPTQAITMGIGSILKAKKIVVMASGAAKADAVYGMLEGPVSTDCPASALRNHPDVVLIVDEEAASKL